MAKIKVKLKEYANEYFHTEGNPPLIPVKKKLKVTTIVLNEGKFLRKNIDWIRSSKTVIKIIYSLKEGDSIYITGII